jgi:hypothetical protein
LSYLFQQTFYFRASNTKQIFPLFLSTYTALWAPLVITFLPILPSPIRLVPPPPTQSSSFLHLSPLPGAQRGTMPSAPLAPMLPASVPSPRVVGPCSRCCVPLLSMPVAAEARRGAAMRQELDALRPQGAHPQQPRSMERWDDTTEFSRR